MDTNLNLADIVITFFLLLDLFFFTFNWLYPTVGYWPVAIEMSS